MSTDEAMAALRKLTNYGAVAVKIDGVRYIKQDEVIRAVNDLDRALARDKVKHR